MRYVTAIIFAAVCGCAATPEPEPELVESIPAVDWKGGFEARPTPAGVEIDLDREWMREWMKDPFRQPQK